MNSFFRALRIFHTKNFADYFSTSRRAHDEYVYGIVFVLFLVALTVFSWGVILIVMKYRSGQFGCAAGKPFHTHSEGSVRTQSSSGRGAESLENDSSLDSGSNEGSTASSIVGQTTNSSALAANRRRARRTRVAFLVFGVGAITIMVLLMVFSFSRIKESIETSESSLVATQDIIDQVRSALRSVESAGQFAIQVVSTTNFDLLTLCPNASSVGYDLGIDLEGFAAQASADFSTLKMIVENNLTTFNDTVQNIQDIKEEVEVNLEYTQRYSWIIPGLLLGVAITATFAMLGVTLAWRGKSGKTFQKGMSYAALPMLIVFSLVCWTLTMAAAAGTISTGDACTGAGQYGGPDATAVNMLNQSQLDQNGTAYRMMYAYTNACRGESPTLELEALEELLQNSVNDIWSKISSIDSLGRENISKACGIELGDDFDNFLEGIRQLAKSLSTIRKAFDSTIGTLQCKNINPIYVDVIHESLCNEVAPGFGIGFVLLLALSICIMVLITLRAAWLHKGGTSRDYDKVYDENEVAENMVLDEYEEYLAYISKYKHEWEDYEGINHAIATQDASRERVPDSKDAVVPLSSNDDDVYVDEGDVGESVCESSAAESSLPDDISFPSLQLTPSVTEAAAGIMVVPYLLPRNYSDDEDEDREAFEIISPRAKAALGVPNTIHTTSMNGDDASTNGGSVVDWQQEPEQHRETQDDAGIGLPSAIHTSPANADEDSKNDERVMDWQQEREQHHGTKDVEDGNPTPKSQSSWNCFEDVSDNEVRQEQTISPSPHRRDFPKHIPRLSDADSIVDKIMRSFDAPSGADDDDHIVRMYGVRIRTKESIEAEMDLHYGRSREENECRDPPPPPDPPMSGKRMDFNAYCDGDESNNPFMSRTELPKSPSRSVSDRMQEMITKFNHFG